MTLTSRYASYARAQDGKITEYTEYMDPIRAGRTMAALSYGEAG